MCIALFLSACALHCYQLCPSYGNIAEADRNLISNQDKRTSHQGQYCLSFLWQSVLLLYPCASAAAASMSAWQVLECGVDDISFLHLLWVTPLFMTNRNGVKLCT